MPIDVDQLTRRVPGTLGLGDEPFVVCLGRVDAGKEADLVERFARFRNDEAADRIAGPVVGAPPTTPGSPCSGRCRPSTSSVCSQPPRC